MSSNPLGLCYPSSCSGLYGLLDKQSAASKSAIGYILSQLGDDNKEHVASYNGRSLRPSVRNYDLNVVSFASNLLNGFVILE
jgi:hypothetical protein